MLLTSSLGNIEVINLAEFHAEFNLQRGYINYRKWVLCEKKQLRYVLAVRADDFFNRFGKIKDGPTTPLCATLFLSIFFSRSTTAPAPPSRFYFFSSLLLNWLAPLGLHCLKTFVCASEHACVSLVFFAVLLLVTQQLIFFVRLFLSWLHYCSIVLCLIVQQQRTLTSPTYPASVFDNHPVMQYRDTARFYYYYYYYCYYNNSAERNVWYRINLHGKSINVNFDYYNHFCKV